MLMDRWHFPESMTEVIRKQLIPEQVGNKVSLLGTLQFTRRLLAQTGLDFGRDQWELSPSDPFILATKLSPEVITELVTLCREDYINLLESVNLTSWESAITAW